MLPSSSAFASTFGSFSVESSATNVPPEMRQQRRRAGHLASLAEDRNDVAAEEQRPRAAADAAVTGASDEASFQARKKTKSVRKRGVHLYIICNQKVFCPPAIIFPKS
jgi:hypothetical protein